MKNKFLLILFSLHLIIYAQLDENLLFKEWIKVKTTMLDGSKNLTSTKFNGLDYEEWKFTPDEFISNLSPILMPFETKNKLILNKNKIKLHGGLSHYEIVKLTEDSLIVVLRIKDINQPDKILKKYFVNYSKIKSLNFYKTKKDSILNANPFFTPKLKSLVITTSLNFDTDIRKNFNDYHFICNIVISPKNKNVALEIINNNAFKEHQNSFFEIKNKINGSYDQWEIKGFENFDKIIIPIIFYSDMSKGIKNFILFSNSIEDIKNKDILSYQETKSYNEYFEKAINYFKNNNYELSIKYFIEAYKINPKNVDALYNIANIFLNSNQKENACLVLKQLKDLEQVEGSKLFNENCK